MKDKRERLPLSRFEIWTLALWGIGILVAAVTGAAIFWQGKIGSDSLYEIRKQYPELKKSADAAKSSADAAYANVRPWIKIRNVELRNGVGPIKTLMFHWPLTGKPVPPVIQVKASVVNVGHSVAQDVEVVPELFFGKFVSDKWHDVVTSEQKLSCRSAASLTPSGSAGIVFPSESLDRYMGVGGMVHDTDVMHAPGTPIARSAASLIVCVNYRGAPTTRFQTQALFGLYEDNSVFIELGTDADANRLRLIRDENGDHAN